MICFTLLSNEFQVNIFTNNYPTPISKCLGFFMTIFFLVGGGGRILKENIETIFQATGKRSQCFYQVPRSKFKAIVSNIYNHSFILISKF